MSSSLLEAALAHHVWATSRVIEACLNLGEEELKTSVPGTRGPMLETLRHLVLSDAFDLFTLTGDPAFHIDEEHLSLAEARDLIERNGGGWARVHLSVRSTPTRWCTRSTRPTGINGGLPSDSGWPGP